MVKNVRAGGGGEGIICKEVWIMYKRAEFFINLVLT